MRAFIAVELTSSVMNSIAGIQAELKKSRGDVKWVPPDICHITLKFLGEIKDDQVEALRAIMIDCAQKTKPFPVTVNTVGAFPTMAKPNIIWLGLTDEHNILATLAGEIEDKVNTLGFIKEVRPFTPHITIGRTRPGSHKTISQALQMMDAPDQPLDVSGLTLFHSTLSSAGPTYKPLFQIPLK